MASAPLLPSPGRNPRSQKRAKDRSKRQPAHGQSVSDKQTNGTPSFLHSSLSPQASAVHWDLGISGKHHSRLAAMPSPSVAPKLHPAARPLLPSPGRDPRSQKCAKDRAKRQPAHGQSVSDKQTNGAPSFLHSSLSPQASAEHADLGIPGKHHSRLAAMPSPSVALKLHPAALSPADVALFPTTTSPGAAEGSEMGNPTPSDP